MALHSDQRRQVSLPGTRLSLDASTFTSDPASTSSTGGLTATVTSTDTVVVPPPAQTTTTMTSVVGTQPSVTDTSSATQTSVGSDPNFTFGTMPYTMDTCGSTTVGWDYIGADCNITLLVSSTVLPNPGGVSSSIVGLVIGQDVDAASDSFSWSPVNLTAGRYVLRATGPNIAAESTIFTIVNGTDTSCLSGSPSPSSTASATSTPSGTSVILTSSSSGVLPTSSSVSLPVTNAVSSRARAGAIAGGIVGGVAIVVAAVAAYFFFGLCRRTPTRSRSGRRGHLGKWGGLSSRDSGMDEGLPVSTAPTSGKSPLGLGIPKRRETTESTGAILTSSHGHNASRGVSDEDVSTLAHEEKVASSRGMEYFQNVPPLTGSRRRSSLSTASPPISPVSEPPSARGSYGRTRAKSSSQSHRANALAKLDGDSSSPASSVPTTPRTRSPTVPRRSVDSMQLRTFDAPSGPMQVASPVAAVSNAAAMNRTSSGNNPRRATRKPVPTLDEADMMPPPSATSLTTPTLSSSYASSTTMSRGSSVSSSIVAGRSPAPSPHPVYNHRADSGSGSTLRAQGALPAPGRQHSREDLIAAGMELPNLNHKSSFGDKQVHYIIPDMPPPPRA